MAAVVWRDVGGKYEIGFRWDDWTPPEIADLIGSRPVDDWIALATPFRDHLKRTTRPGAAISPEASCDTRAAQDVS